MILRRWQGRLRHFPVVLIENNYDLETHYKILWGKHRGHNDFTFFTKPPWSVPAKLLSTHIVEFFPPLVLEMYLTRGGKNSSPKWTPKIFGRLRRPKSTFMNLIDSLLSLFWISPPQAGKFWGFWTRFARFLAVFQREIDQNTTKNAKIFRLRRGKFSLNPPPCSKSAPNKGGV